jgi:branched-chain amino acid transport system ATP-binding protein
MAEPILVVDNVCKHFGGLRAVNAASLTVEEGRVTAVIGPNGAGKTTLFALITGFLAPTSGRIAYNGAPITGIPVHQLARRGIARTFQIVQPFAGLSV